MDIVLPVGARRWLTDVRHELAALPLEPTVAAIGDLSDRLAQHALRLDSPRTGVDIVMDTARYRRHLIAGGGDDGYSALLIEWPAAHRTPIHDHAGLWGIELVLDGALEVEEFAIDCGDLDRPALMPERTLMLGVGDAAVFHRRDYAHRCRNLSAQRPALSLHVYGGTLDRYQAFHAGAQGEYAVRVQHARIDTAVPI